MNYLKHYNKLIKRAKNRIIEGYTEIHHIVPRCMGGSDNEDNLVLLTPEEHFVLHQLLFKIYKDTEYRFLLLKAVNMMTVDSPNTPRNNKVYGWIRREFSKAMSNMQSGKNNSQYGKMWISNIELKEITMIDKNFEIPEGWVKGRNVWNRMNVCVTCNEIYFNENLKYCSNECRKNEPKALSEEYINTTIEYAKNYINSKYANISQFLKYECNISQPSITKRFKTIPFYAELTALRKNMSKEVFKKEFEIYLKVLNFK